MTFVYYCKACGEPQFLRLSADCTWVLNLIEARCRCGPKDSLSVERKVIVPPFPRPGS